MHIIQLLLMSLVDYDNSEIPNYLIEICGDDMSVKLGSICKFQSGGTPSKSKEEYFGGKVPWITTTALNGALIGEDDAIDWITDKAISETAAKIVPANSIMVGTRVGVGKTAINSIPMSTSQDIISLIGIDEGVWSKDFLCKFIQSRSAYLNSQARGATIKGIKIDVLASLEVPEIELDVQKKISGIIDKVKGIKADREKETELLDELIKARFVEMFGNIIDTCDVGYYIKSLTAGKSLAGEAECDNKVLKTGAASFDFFDATQVKNLPLDYEPQAEHLVRPGDIIISRMNTAELTGATAYVWDVQDNVYLPDRLWKANIKEECNPLFVWQMLIQPATKEQIRRECSGTSGSMKNISKSGMLAIRVKKVPFELQNQFAEFVKQVDKSKVVA